MQHYRSRLWRDEPGLQVQGRYSIDSSYTCTSAVQVDPSAPQDRSRLKSSSTCWGFLESQSWRRKKWHFQAVSFRSEAAGSCTQPWMQLSFVQYALLIYQNQKALHWAAFNSGWLHGVCEHQLQSPLSAKKTSRRMQTRAIEESNG